MNNFLILIISVLSLSNSGITSVIRTDCFCLCQDGKKCLQEDLSANPSEKPEMFCHCQPSGSCEEDKIFKKGNPFLILISFISSLL